MFRHCRSLRAIEAARQATARAMDSFAAQERRKLIEEFASLSPRLSGASAAPVRDDHDNR